MELEGKYERNRYGLMDCITGPTLRTGKLESVVMDILLTYSTRVYPKVSGLSEMNNKHSLRSDTKGYGCRTH
jgi:hypothetical protein